MKRLLTLALVGALLFHSQSRWVAHLHAAVSVISSVADGGDDIFFTTSSAINTTGASLLVACTSSLSAVTLTDSEFNVWTPLTMQQSASGGRTQVFYSVNPRVSGSHTFTASASFPSLGVLALVGTDDMTTFDQQNGSSIEDSGEVAIQPGSVTPSEANEIVISCLTFSNEGTVGVDAPFTPPALTHPVSIGNYGMSMAYNIQTTATARNPTWTHSNGAYLSSSISTFTVAPYIAPLPSGRPCCMGGVF